jgi:hypothetical protein
MKRQDSARFSICTPMVQYVLGWGRRPAPRGSCSHKNGACNVGSEAEEARGTAASSRMLVGETKTQIAPDNDDTRFAANVAQAVLVPCAAIGEFCKRKSNGEYAGSGHTPQYGTPPRGSKGQRSAAVSGGSSKLHQRLSAEIWPPSITPAGESHVAAVRSNLTQRP